MLLDPISALFCAQMTAMTPGMTPTPCQTAINATSAQTQTTDMLNKLQNYMETATYKIVDKDILYGSAGLIYLINSWNTKTFSAIIPLKPFEFDTNLAMNSINLGVKFKWEF